LQNLGSIAGSQAADLAGRGGQARNNTTEDNERYTVTYPLLGNDFADPHEQHGAGGNGGNHERPLQQVGVADEVGVGHAHAGLLDEQHHAERLNKCQRQGEQAGILVELAAAHFALFLERFELGDHLGKQLDNNGRVNVRPHAHHNNGEVG